MIILRQKQYTSILFKVKTRLGTARNYLANKLQNRIYKHSENINKALKDHEEASKLHNNKLLESSKIVAKNLGANVKKDTSHSSFLHKYKTENGETKYDIHYNPFQGAESLSHEVGHLINDINDNRLTRKGRDNNILSKNKKSFDTAIKFKESIDSINKKYKKESEKRKEGKRNKAIKDSIVSLRNTGKLDTGTGIGESFRRMGEGNAIVGEELSATRKALKILKKNGATKDELNLAKTNLGLAAKTYKEGAKIHILNPIQNKIQIPSRRRK